MYVPDAFRMDDRRQRIIVEADGGQGIGVFGWEVADGAALDAIAARLEAAGTEVTRGSRALADERLVRDANAPTYMDLALTPDADTGDEMLEMLVPHTAAKQELIGISR